MATDGWIQNTGSPQAIATYSGNWTVLEGGINVRSGANNIYGDGGTYNTARYNAVSPSASQRSKMTATAAWIGGGVYAGPGVRAQAGANTSYHVDCNTSEYYLSKCVAGSQSTLAGPISLSLAAGDIIALDVATVGSDAVLKVYKALAASPTVFNQVGSDYTDSSSPILTAGHWAVFVYGNSANIGPGPWEGIDNGGGGGGGISIPVVQAYRRMMGMR